MRALVGSLIVFSLGFSLLAGCASAAGGDDDASASTGSAVVYGVDGRKDVYEASSAQAAIARQSMVAIFGADTLIMTDPSHVKVDADPLSKYENLCKGQKFASQPAGSDCSGTLIADDLVLTAGHCFTDDDHPERTPEDVCQNTLRIAFDYYYDAPGKLHPMTSDSVYRCQELVVQHNDPDGAPSPRLDYGIIRLDRSAVAAGRVALRPNIAPSLAASAPLVVIGAPTGLPLKVEATGKVLDPRTSASSSSNVGDYFYANTDTFGGNSGSGVLDASTMQLVGLLVSGGDDYVKRGSCMVVASCKESGCKGKPGEEIGYVKNAIDALCAAHADEPLCQDLEPSAAADPSTNATPTDDDDATE